MQTKDFKAQVKATGDDTGGSDDLGKGEFTALVSVFSNEDSYGDVIIPGAFADDLKRWEESGDAIPVIWSHDWVNPFSHIGYVTKAEETEKGLQVTCQLDMDNPTATQVYKLLERRGVTQFSFAFDILDAGEVTKDDNTIYELRKLKIHEVGPCLLGVNQETELIDVKAQQFAQGQKAGKVLSQKNYDTLVKARDTLTTVLESATPDDDSKTSLPPGGDETNRSSQVERENAVKAEDLNVDKAENGSHVSIPRRASAVALITNLR